MYSVLAVMPRTDELKVNSYCETLQKLVTCADMAPMVAMFMYSAIFSGTN
jgi:hypothetical protein